MTEPPIRYARTEDGVNIAYTVRSLARTSAGVSFEDRGEQTLKGIGEALRVWAVMKGE